MNRIETPLGKKLKNRIETSGPITFRDFMEQALFHPELGFYSKGHAIGSRDGAFNTTAMFSCFAFCLARAVERAEVLVGESLRIVELGAGTGELGKRLLSFLSSPREYVVIETSRGLRQKQEAAGLKVEERIEDLSPSPSFVFGNEVLDALPVHRVMGEGQGKLLEMYVGVDQTGCLVEEFGEVSTPKVFSRLHSEGISLGRGQVAEVCLAIDPFLEAAASIISKGYLFIIDYGDIASILYHHSRRNGGLRCYYQQTQVHDPFDRIGDQDITTDVDFTAVETAARSGGLLSAGKAWQGTWLRDLGIHEFHPPGLTTQDVRRQIEQLISPARLGSAFDVLAWKTTGLPDAPGFSAIP